MKSGFIESKPAHLLLLPLYFVTHKFLVLCRPFDPGKVTSITSWLGNFLVSLLFSVIPGFILFIVLTQIIKIPKIKAAVSTTLIVVFFFLESELEFFSRFNSPLLRKRYILLFGIILIIILIVKALKSEKLAVHVNTYLNLLWTGLILYNVAILITLFPQVKPSSYIPKDSTFHVSCSKCPDIYYIILDAYTSNESLKKYWGYDNSSFTDSLKNMGFFIAESRTKFVQTYYSMTSAFNMSNDSSDINKLHRYEAMQLVKNNIVTQKMNEAGYEVINLSFFEIANNSAYYDFSNAGEGGEKSLFNRFLNNTFLKSITNLFSELDTYEQHIKTLHRLVEVSETKIDRPRFVYTHLLAPHQPYVIDSLSGKIPFYKLSKSNSKTGYLNQLKGVNKLVLNTVEEILSHYNPNNPLVIIIQGDHGFRYLPDNPEEGTTILNAYYLPKGVHNLYPGISPYNTFRVVFNTYFNSNLELLEETASENEH